MRGYALACALACALVCTLGAQAAPNRLRGYYGAAKAADAVGQKKKAGGYWSQLARLTREADGDRPELRELRDALAANQ